MLSSVFPSTLVAKAKEIIERHTSATILMHTHPDGDALGSSLALMSLLKGMGKEVRVVVESKPPILFEFLQGFKEIIVAEEDKAKAEEAIQSASLLCCLDFNEVKRVGGLQEVLQTSKAERLVVDHHLNLLLEGDVLISQPEMSSTAEVLFHLIWEMGIFQQTEKAFSEGIYCGIMCDTGNFSYNSNSPELYVIVSELLKKGIDKNAIFDHVFREYSAQRMQLMGLLLNRKMRVYPKCHSAVLSLTSEEMRRYNHQSGDAEGFANLPLNIKGILFSVFLKEEPGKIKVSLRSRGDFDVEKIARSYYNGGGHKNASGGELYCSMQEAIDHFISKLPIYKKEADRALSVMQ